MKTHVVALVAATTLALTACAGGDTTPSPSASPTPTESVAPLPSPSASPTTPEASPTPTTVATTVGGLPILPCETWDDGEAPVDGPAAMDYHRNASICVGMSYAEAQLGWPGPLAGEPECPWVLELADAPNLWIAAVSEYENPGDEIQFFIMRYWDDASMANPEELGTTEEGIRIGSSRAAVLAAYPGAVSEAYTDDAGIEHDILRIHSADGYHYVFDMDPNFVKGMAWGDIETIPGHLCAL